MTVTSTLAFDQVINLCCRWMGGHQD